MNQQTLQFNPVEMQQFNNAIGMCMQIGKKPTPSLLQQMGYNYEQAKRIMYIYNMSTGKVSINSDQDVVKHLKKIHGNAYKITIQDLEVSTVSNVPRVAVVGGITQQPYDIWNSKNYKGSQAFYKVIEVSGRKITVETGRKPALQYGAAKKIDGQFEIKGVTAEGKCIITFDKNYCKLVNRFCIVGSLRVPEFHLGKYTMIAFEGTKIYVYATSMGIRDQVRYNGNQRVYDYGLDPSTIKVKLDNVAKNIYQRFDCAKAIYENANSKYILIPKTREEEEQEEFERQSGIID